MMLDYLFIAEHHNGDITEQTPEDVSTRDPARSAFYDAINHNKIKRFSLVGKGHVFLVDLIDGHFEIDGRTIYTKPPPPAATLEVIYYRQTQRKIMTDPSGTTMEQPVVRYYIGWQCHHKGKNYKYELGVD